MGKNDIDVVAARQLALEHWAKNALALASRLGSATLDAALQRFLRGGETEFSCPVPHASVRPPTVPPTVPGPSCPASATNLLRSVRTHGLGRLRPSLAGGSA
eukprot:SAG11_NODE_2893_length_2860_cov_8.281420_4_plen_102_part_00